MRGRTGTDLVVAYAGLEAQNKSEPSPPSLLPLPLFPAPTCAQYITWTVSPSAFVCHLLG